MANDTCGVRFGMAFGLAAIFLCFVYMTVCTRAEGGGRITGFEDYSYISVPPLWSKVTTRDTGSPNPIEPLPVGGCFQIHDHELTDLVFALRYDSLRQRTEFYVGDYPGNQVVRHDIDASLHHTQTSLGIDYELPWLAEDLDGVGNIELVLQDGDPGIGGNGYLQIRSAPSWKSRGRFVFPDSKFYMYPVPINIDDDEELELFVSAYGFGNYGSVAIIDYDAVNDSFTVIQRLTTPPSTGGQAAVGDFDSDGHLEFLIGDDFGYLLFEHNGDSLSFVDRVVKDSVLGVNKWAVAVRLRPDGVLRALLGHSSGAYTSRFQLLRAVADNEFEIEDMFKVQESPGGGLHPCFGADIDCDGLDEMIAYLWPVTTVIEWDESANDYVVGCAWDADKYGVPFQYQLTDLDQDGAREWALTDWASLDIRIFEDKRCPHCWHVDKGLVSWWPFDLGNDGMIQDLWGGLHGSVIGGAFVISEMISKAMSFDGIDGYVQVGDEPRLDFGREDFSIDTWVQTASHNPVNPLISKSDSDRGWALWIEDGIRLALQLEGTTSSTVYSDDRSEFSDGDWHHVAVAVDRSNLSEVSFYVDGFPIGVEHSNAYVGDIGNYADLLIGAQHDSPKDTVFFSGMLDEVSLWDHVLNLETVSGIYQAGFQGKCRSGIEGCDCAEHGDVANDDHIINMADVIALAGYLFRGGAKPKHDPDCPHTHRGDVNCDGRDNVQDLVVMADHVFRNNLKALCDPCGCDPYPSNCR